MIGRIALWVHNRTYNYGFLHLPLEVCYTYSMHYDLIIKNGTIVTPSETFQGGIAVKDGKIALAGYLESSCTADEIYDASGRHILPGIIDAHVHFRDPGLTEKEDFETGSMAAAFGGVTFIADMPNTIPVTYSVKHFNEKARIAGEKSYIDFGIFALLNNDNSAEMEGLKKAGALGYKVFLGASTGELAAPSAGVMLEQMVAAKNINMRIGFHAETNEINEHFTSLMKTFDPSIMSEGLLLSNARPVISENLAIQTAVIYALYTRAKIHIHHVTSLDGAFAIAEAKQNGKIDITCETCPHYLLFDADMEKAHKVYPPIRDAENRKWLWDTLQKGVIDMLATDHAPHLAREKALPIWEAPGGLAGVETFVPLMLTEVNNGRLSLNDFVRLASEMPAKIWGIYPKKGSLKIGADADITIVDMNKESVIRADELHSKGKTSPYDGMAVRGCAAATIVRGKFVMKDGELTGSKGYGKLVFADS